MCNEIKCAVQENVQIGCTGNVHIAAVWMMGEIGEIMGEITFVKLLANCTSNYSFVQFSG